MWFRLATSQQELGQPDQALQTMEQGLKVGVPPVSAEFSIATIHAQKGDKEKAFEHLQKALDAGYNKLEQFDSDVHLASLRGEPGSRTQPETLPQYSRKPAMRFLAG